MPASKPFRETLWFKKGILDADLAQAAAEKKDAEAATAVDMLPVEDRYLDDGSVTGEDSKMFSVHTGTTQYVPMVGMGRPTRDRLPTIVQEMKGRRARFALYGAGVAIVCVIIAACVV